MIVACVFCQSFLFPVVVCLSCSETMQSRESIPGMVNIDDAAVLAMEDLMTEYLPMCRAMPKLELHAHLNGSIRAATLLYEFLPCDYLALSCG